MLAVFDSDGCVFDTMEPKHRRTFIPQVVRHFGLEALEQELTEVWCRINLYSRSRGLNRFPGLIATLDTLRKDYGFSDLPTLPALREWLAGAPTLSNPALEQAIGNTPEVSEARQELTRVLAWSQDVNNLGKTVLADPGIFSGAEEAMNTLAHQGFTLGVVSQSPRASVIQHWQSRGLITRHHLSDRMFGQEDGKKADCLIDLTRHPAEDRIPPLPSPGPTDRIQPALPPATDAQAQHPPGIFFGDAPADLEAARKAGFLFFPIIPGREVQSWQSVLIWLDSWAVPGKIPGKNAETGLIRLQEDFLTSLPPLDEGGFGYNGE